MKIQEKIAFVGGGNMAQALIGGLLTEGMAPDGIRVSGRDLQKLMTLKQQWPVYTTTVNTDVVKDCGIVVLCVKPAQMKAVCVELKNSFQEKKPLIISVATGITLTLLQEWLGDEVALVRAMPNTPCTIGVGVTGFSTNAIVTTSQIDLVKRLFSSVGLSRHFEDENKIDAVTALSGCGPAYVYLFIEALQNAGVAIGLSEEEATMMTEHMVFGAARLAKESEKKAAVLRQEVASPGGATEQGLKVLETSGFRHIIHETVNAALARSKEVTQKLQSKK